MTVKLALVFPMMISFFCLHAQDTKKETIKYGTGGSEVFYINKKDKSREGPYVLSRSGKTFVSGFYSGGQKDSAWTYYAFDQKILSKHFYKKGIKCGIWEFYRNDSLIWTYNFDSSKANFIQPEDTALNTKTYVAYQDEHNNWIYYPPEKHALQTNSDYFYWLMVNLTYPEDAQNNNQQGQVNIAVLVDQLGNPESYEVGISSGHPLLDAEALRVVKLTHLEYIPAENKGVKVKSLVLQKVNFRLESY